MNYRVSRIFAQDRAYITRGKIHAFRMSDSHCIIAINQDADAPLFDVADYSIVGNLHEVIPVLTEEIKRRGSEIQFKTLLGRHFGRPRVV